MTEAPSARLGLIGPSVNDLVSQGDDVIRALIVRLDLFCLLGSSGSFASRPATAVVDYYYFATDTGVLYRYSGSAWVTVGGGAPAAHASSHQPGGADSLDWTTLHQTGTYAARPAASAGLNGVRYHATDKGTEYQCIAGAWVLIRATPLEVTVLPSSPVDGQEIYYVASTSAGVVWHLRYRAASGSAYKWEYVGGGDIVNEALGQVAVAGGNTYNSTGGAPTITLPLAGDYLFAHGVRAHNAGTNVEEALTVALKLGAAAPQDDDCVSFNHAASVASQAAAISRTLRRNSLASGTVVQQYAKSVNGQDLILARWIGVHPIRVG